MFRMDPEYDRNIVRQTYTMSWNNSYNLHVYSLRLSLSLSVILFVCLSLLLSPSLPPVPQVLTHSFSLSLSATLAVE